MEFVFGNSGKGYGLLHQSTPSNPRNERISEYMQKINTFDVGSGEKLYTYKVVSDGVSFTTIFSLYAHDNSFGRSAFYNHVKWREYGRMGFLESNFMKGLDYTFASQSDINALRESGKLSITENIVITEATGMSTEALSNILHSLLSGSGKKIAIISNMTDNEEKNVNNMRAYIKQIFVHLPVDLRATTSFVIGCDLDSFVASDYRLCVLPKAPNKKRSRDSIVYISPDDVTFDQNDEWAKYIKWITGLCQQDKRDEFFVAFEKAVGKETINALDSLIGFQKKYTAPPKVEVPKTKPTPVPKVAQTQAAATTISKEAGTEQLKQMTMPASIAKQKNETASLQPEAPTIMHGKLSLTDGEYIGEILNKKPHGNGEIVWSKNNKHGYLAGYSYIGQWLDGKMHGWGIMCERGNINCGWRIGVWANDKKSRGFCLARNRKDILYFQDSNERHPSSWYLGSVSSNGFPQGWGVQVIWLDSKWYNLYLGHWADGRLNGWGICRIADGRVLFGTWENGNFIM